MNRAFLIIFAPVFLVAAGYIVVLHTMGISPGYARLALAIALVVGVAWWLSRRTARKPKTGAR